MMKKKEKKRNKWHVGCPDTMWDVPIQPVNARPTVYNTYASYNLLAYFPV